MRKDQSIKGISNCYNLPTPITKDNIFVFTLTEENLEFSWYLANLRNNIITESLMKNNIKFNNWVAPWDSGS